MLVPILIFDVALVAWSLHLMQQAVEDQEFSLMLAGFWWRRQRAILWFTF